MNLLEGLFCQCLVRYGSDAGQWPALANVYRRAALVLSENCRQRWRDTAREDAALTALCRGGMPELDVDGALMARLQRIPNRHPRAFRARPLLPGWRTGLVTAMASAVLGIAIGYSGLIESGDEALYRELVADYQVSVWLAEQEQ